MKSRKVVIWGHSLHSHTHSYIHYAFYRAFNHLGHETYWFDSIADVNLDLSGALFIVEGQVDGNIPLLKDCKYLLHNCNLEKYQDANVDFKVLQVYSNDVLDRDVEKIHECEYYQPSIKTLYQPWATDLLPHEFEKYPLITNFSGKNNINWVGSVMGGLHGNINELRDYANVAAVNGASFQVHNNAEPAQAIQLIRDSYMAPALQGAWQVENGYVPCRIFKNISYGHLGATNSETVYKLYDELITFSANSGMLFHEMKNDINNFDVDKAESIRAMTREKHTYVNRIKNIIDIMEI